MVIIKNLHMSLKKSFYDLDFSTSLCSVRNDIWLFKNDYEKMLNQKNENPIPKETLSNRLFLNPKISFR